jgi:hypothetical protein
MVVNLIESLNNSKEKAGEVVEPTTEHSLALKDKDNMFVEAFEHKIGETEE